MRVFIKSTCVQTKVATNTVMLVDNRIANLNLHQALNRFVKILVFSTPPPLLFDYILTKQMIFGNNRKCVC